MNARTTYRLACIARGELRTVAAISAPCSVKANGGRRKAIFAAELDITDCDLQIENSLADKRNIKSAGKRSRLRLTAWLVRGFVRRTGLPNPHRAIPCGRV